MACDAIGRNMKGDYPSVPCYKYGDLRSKRCLNDENFVMLRFASSWLIYNDIIQYFEFVSGIAWGSAHC